MKCLFLSLFLVGSPLLAAEPLPKWAEAAAAKKPMTAEETKAFMKKLAEYVFENHLKKDVKSPQKGMLYEYFDFTRKGQFDQWVQGEALDTMHDGCWFGLALVNAYRATGDPYYKDFLTKWVLPFYVKVLNNSDTLFSAKRDDSDQKANKFNKEHQLQEGEKGFCPYWWDDGASVSLERRRTKKARPAFSATDEFTGKDNPQFKLAGYSHGSSNHLAQDLAVFLQMAWLLLKNSKDPSDLILAKETAEAAKNLHECRLRHHGTIPAVVAAAGLTNNNDKWLKQVPDYQKKIPPNNHFTRILGSLTGDQRIATPGFADDQQYLYYSTIAKTGGKLPDDVAFKLIYDAYTEPQLYRMWSDDAPVPPGINRFDLSPIYAKNGKFESYRSERKVGIGSRMGPQMMIACGWALQAMNERKRIWADQVHTATRTKTRVDESLSTTTDEVKGALQTELFDGLRTWEAIFAEKGYIPTGIGAGTEWDRFSDTGGYAHLISAASQYLLLLDRKRDWEVQFGN